jgi:N-acetylmuramoyl-L-alanine amidase
LTPSRKFAALLIASLAGAAATVYSIRAQAGGGQPPAAPPSAASTMNPNLVVLDPAHGGPDPGATLSDNTVEKNLTLAMVLKLRGALAAANFTVVTTRDAEIPDTLTTDQRAEIANHAHAVACIVLHATATGSGVHVYTSTLQPSDSENTADGDTPFAPIPWEMAQAGFKRQSLQLASDLISALATTNLPRGSGSAPVRPLDNLMCPAIAVEIAPLAVPGTDPRPITDAEYQQRVVDALVAALKTWRTEAIPPPNAAAPNAQATAAARAIAAAEAAGRAASGGKEAQ